VYLTKSKFGKKNNRQLKTIVATKQKAKNVIHTSIYDIIQHTLLRIIHDILRLMMKQKTRRQKQKKDRKSASALDSDDKKKNRIHRVTFRVQSVFAVASAASVVRSRFPNISTTKKENPEIYDRPFHYFTIGQ